MIGVEEFKVVKNGLGIGAEYTIAKTIAERYGSCTIDDFTMLSAINGIAIGELGEAFFKQSMDDYNSCSLETLERVVGIIVEWAGWLERGVRE